ncbi:hypothetical protein D3C75_552990 [compost metagenome]
MARSSTTQWQVLIWPCGISRASLPICRCISYLVENRRTLLQLIATPRVKRWKVYISKWTNCWRKVIATSAASLGFMAAHRRVYMPRNPRRRAPIMTRMNTWPTRWRCLKRCVRNTATNSIFFMMCMNACSHNKRCNWQKRWNPISRGLSKIFCRLSKVPG